MASHRGVTVLLNVPLFEPNFCHLMSHQPARQELARIIEHTLLKSDATRAEIEQLCSEAKAHGFFSVVVNGCRVAQAAHLLDGTEVKVTAAVALPWGAADADVKRFE